MMINDDATIRDILTQTRRIAIIGLSPDPGRPSHHVAKGLLAAGYEIVPVNPKASQILGRESFAELGAVSESIDLVDVFRDPSHVPDIVDACIDKRVRNLWLQEGVIHHEAARYAADQGIQVVMDRCIHKEYHRLLA